MEKIKISKGFTPKLTGDPDLSMIRLPFPSTIGCSATDIPFIRPKLLVKEGDAVKTGTPVFTDKRDPSIQYVSPATGRVKKILFGERRRLLEVIIDPEKNDAFIESPPPVCCRSHRHAQGKLSGPAQTRRHLARAEAVPGHGYGRPGSHPGHDHCFP